jgi:membrane-associated protease RseP (regulator of RpoE activity)
MRVLARILFLVACLAACLAVAETLPWRGVGRGFAAVFLTVPLGILAIVAHELGHAWAVRRLGGRVENFTILGVDFIGSSEASLAPSRSGHEIGGHVGYFFEGGETRREHALIAAAGPAANFLLAALARLLVLFWMTFHSDAAPVLTTASSVGSASSGVRPPASLQLPSEDEVRHWLAANPHPSRVGAGGVVANIAGALAVLSAGIGLGNLVPFKGSDGEALKDSLRPSWRR